MCMYTICSVTSSAHRTVSSFVSLLEYVKSEISDTNNQTHLTDDTGSEEVSIDELEEAVKGNWYCPPFVKS